MAQTTAGYLDGLIECFSEAFHPAKVVLRDERPKRSLLELWGRWGSYRVRLYEVVGPTVTRKYAYYVLDNKRVIVGFDNAPDPKVLRLKYGKSFAQHLHESIPHRHSIDKKDVELTDEMTCEKFTEWVQANLGLSD